MNSATLSHKVSQKKALLIWGIEKAVPMIPEVHWVVVLVDGLLCWSERTLDVKKQMSFWKRLAKLTFFSWGMGKWSLTLLL